MLFWAVVSPEFKIANSDELWKKLRITLNEHAKRPATVHIFILKLKLGHLAYNYPLITEYANLSYKKLCF